jgi:S-adenosylmethionine/arginine decarboxylase-like enzyme
MQKTYATLLLASIISFSSSQAPLNYSGKFFTHETEPETRAAVVEATHYDYQEHYAWGLHTTIDLEGCDYTSITNAEYLHDCFVELCEKIEMKRFGEPMIVHFGDCPAVAGFTGIQLIETSDITCHLANESLKGYFDIFSCKWYNPFDVADFLKNWFKASGYRITIIQRV